MPEQALVVKTGRGISVMTGCAHPGIGKIITEVKKSFGRQSIYLAFGGFHLMDKDRRLTELIADELKKSGVGKAGPSHCSGREAEKVFANRYGDDFIPIKVGQIMEI